jgi:hypothetical protein
VADDIFIKEWLADSRIFCFRFTTTGTESTERWFADLVPMLSQWDKNKPFLLLLDLTKAKNNLSPEAMQRSIEISNRYGDIPGKVAFLIDPNATTYNVDAMVNHVLANTRPLQTFTSEPDAIEWLLED